MSKDSGVVLAGPFKVTNGVTIMPGQSGQVQVEVNQTLPEGVWDVHLTLFSGTVERTRDGKINLPVTDETVLLNPVSQWLLFSFGAAAALILLMAVLMWYLVRRRRAVASVEDATEFI
jgi:hypothetical protein